MTKSSRSPSPSLLLLRMRKSMIYHLYISEFIYMHILSRVESILVKYSLGYFFFSRIGTTLKFKETPRALGLI